MSSTPIRIEPPFGPREPSPDEDRPSGGRLKRAVRRGVWTLLVASLLVVLPFFVLVRTSVFLNERVLGAGWLSIAGGAAATALLLTAYALVAGKRLTGSWRLPSWARKGTFVLAGAYALYGVVYLSASNAKTDDVRSAYLDASPVLRLATSTLVLFDRTLVVTDASRTLEDYRRMGLPPNEASLHFPQPDGWVHALDLRTVGRSRWRNGFMGLYFWGMGFRTLRHRGTADHLHVSLPAG